MGASNEGLRIVFLCIKEGILKPLGIKEVANMSIRWCLVLG